MTTASIAFLGIGLMGFPMARRLCEAGYTVHAWNRSPDKAERLRPFGAQIHLQAAQAVAQADIVISMLENGPVTEQVLFDIAADILRAIEKNEFRPRPTKLCDWCFFKTICPAHVG